jgi:trimeric autotransporter adhesin
MTRIAATFVLTLGVASAQRFVISTVAGGPPGWSGPAAPLNAALGGTNSVVSDASGNIYFSTSMSAVFKVDSKGALTRVAGSYPGYAGDGGPAAQALLSINNTNTQGTLTGTLAIDAQGNLYINDTGNFRIRIISPDGTIATIAGTGVQGTSGDGGPAVDAQLGWVSGIAVDNAGNLYLADQYFAGQTSTTRIRKISSDGTIDTISASAALALQDVAGLATDSNGNLYVADFAGDRVVEVLADGTIIPIAGNGTPGFSGDGGPAIAAQLNFPFGLAFDASGNLYIADTINSRIRKVALDGTINTVAGGGSQYGVYTGPAASSALIAAYGIAIDPGGNLLIADTGQYLIRKVTGGTITTVAGNNNCCYGGDGGPALNAQFAFYPWGGGLALDNKGDLYIADTYDARVRMISPDGSIRRVAGTGPPTMPNERSGDGGPALEATFTNPWGLAVDNSGDLYIADNVVREVLSNGNVTTPAAAAGLAQTVHRMVAVDGSGNQYLASASGYEKVSPDGTISTVTTVSVPGWSMTADAAGNLYLGDIYGNVVRKVAPDGTISVVAGTGTNGFSGDAGQATNAQIGPPTALAVDASGDLFVADSANSRIRIVTPDGIISTIAGNGSRGYSGDGGDASNAQFGSISGLAVGKTGNLYLSDQTYGVIRLVQWLPN